MTEVNSELRQRLVVAHDRDGRCRYDPLAKQELARHCMKPGVSVARMAMLYGVNANLLRKWIDKATPNKQRALALPSCAVPVAPTFVPVQITARNMQSKTVPVPVPATLHLQARLPNGVALEFGATSLDAVSGVIHMLAELACSS